jgi:ribosomal protein L16 Arg81 hydroxylase
MIGERLREARSLAEGICAMTVVTQVEPREGHGPAEAGGLAFDDLIGTIPRESFFAQYWERRPLHIRRTDEGFYDSLLTRADLETLIATGGVRYPGIQLTREGRYIPPEAFTQSHPVGRDSLAGVPDLDRVAKLYGAGATISMPFLHLAWKPLADFTAAIEADFDHPVHANLYLTPGGCQGFTPHYDIHEVFVLQIAGHKRWRVDAPPAPLPHHSQPFSAQPHQATPRVLEVELGPGDLLYLPRGYIHSTATSLTSSLHVTMGMTVFTWIELLAEWFQTSKVYPRYRRALEPGFAHDPAVRQRMKDELPKIIGELQGLTDYDALLETFTRRATSGAFRPIERFETEVVAAPGAAGPGARLR